MLYIYDAAYSMTEIAARLADALTNGANEQMAVIVCNVTAQADDMMASILANNVARGREYERRERKNPCQCPVSVIGQEATIVPWGARRSARRYRAMIRRNS